MNFFPTFFITPLTFLGGVFYSIAMLLEGDAESFLRDQRFRYVAVDARGNIYLNDDKWGTFVLRYTGKVPEPSKSAEK